jgi:hypothetical protein
MARATGSMTHQQLVLEFRNESEIKCSLQPGIAKAVSWKDKIRHLVFPLYEEFFNVV